MGNTEQEDKEAVEELTWVTHPMIEYPQKAAVFWAIFLLVLLAVWVYSHEWIFVILAGLILFGSLRGFVLPTRYTISEEGIEIHRTVYKVRKRWSDFRSHVVERNGVFLSPFSVKHRLENFRGIFLPTGEHHKQVAEFVSKHLEKME